MNDFGMAAVTMATRRELCRVPVGPRLDTLHAATPASQPPAPSLALHPRLATTASPRAAVSLSPPSILSYEVRKGERQGRKEGWREN